MFKVQSSKFKVPSSKLKRYTYIIIIALALAGCGTAQRAKQAVKTVEAASAAKGGVEVAARKSLSLNDRMRLDYLFQEASKLKLQDRHSEALDLLRHCYDIAPDAPEVLYELSLYELYFRNDTVAIDLLEQATRLDPRNTFYKEALATYYLNRIQTEKALPYLEAIAELKPTRSDVLAQLTRIYTSLDRQADAIRALDRIELLEGKMPSVSYQKFALYKRMGQLDKGFAELESLCHEYPHDMNYRLAIADQLLEADREAEALKIYDEVRAAEPQNAALHLSMLQYYRHTGADSLFATTRDSLLYAPKSDTEVRVALLRDLIAQEMRDDSLGTGRRHVVEAFDSLDRRFGADLEILQLRAAYLATYEKQNDSDFVAVMDRVIQLEPANTQAVFYLIQYYGEHQQFEKLEDLCRRAVNTHPEELVCHFYLGIALYQQDKKAEAMKAFEDGIVQKTEESRPAMVADLYSTLGDLYHEAGREADAFAAYDSCLVYQDDNVGCLNNYAYYLSLLGRDLDKAEEMSYRTIRLEPDNKTYLDTYAWILFMKERYAEAAHYIDRVCPPDSTDEALQKMDGVSGVVLEHAGDIAAKNGKMEQAIRFWALAQRVGGEGLTAVLPKKIRTKRYYDN